MPCQNIMPACKENFTDHEGIIRAVNVFDWLKLFLSYSHMGAERIQFITYLMMDGDEVNGADKKSISLYKSNIVINCETAFSIYNFFY